MKKKSIGKNFQEPKFKTKHGRDGYKNKNGRVEAPYPHFRYYKKSKHPALIVGEQPVEEYRYRKVMHSERDGRHLNEKVEPNPNKGDLNPMYIGKRVRHNKKEYFEDKPLPWKYPKK